MLTISMAKKDKISPLMKQYWDIKSAHTDKILLFRMGDFFEMFFEDAQKAAPVLGIALTSRNKKSGDETPMCGVPHHSIGNQINKLLARGYKVAICDQVEDAKQAKGLVKRAVTRVLSPGMVYDPDTLDGTTSNYLMAFDNSSVAFLESTTAEAFFYETTNQKVTERLIQLFNPVEVVLSEIQKKHFFENTERLVSVHEGLTSGPLHKSCQRLLNYAVSMQGDSILATVTRFEKRNFQDRMRLTETVFRHLEVFKTYTGDTEGSLFQAVNRCKTSGGSRRLKQRLLFPLMEAESLDARFDDVSHWAESSELKDLRIDLSKVGDLERRLGKVASPNCHPRDLLSLGESLDNGIKALLRTQSVGEVNDSLELGKRVAARIFKTIEAEAPVNYRQGAFICRGVLDELDELVDLAEQSQAKVTEMEQKERSATGISSLKIRYNNVFGFYIEITNTHKAKVPTDRYMRKQTLTNAERYVTDELNELEKKVLSAKSKRVEVELELFAKLREDILTQMAKLTQLADRVSELDVSSAIAWLSLEQNYVRPTWSEFSEIKITGCRHPVVEQTSSGVFVANDVNLKANEAVLLTGPNMAGKSTMMRQVALTLLLAQSGFFVPATSAELPLADQIFTRIGASDFLTEGLSTFMVEMKETADMLNQATEKSFLILDEVGRGTSTYDGLSLAQSILEWLVSNSKGQVFFATHYHELTGLAESYVNVTNAHMSIHENKGDIEFLYKLTQGPAGKSYGIQVAKLAGIPKSITTRATKLLAQMEAGGVMSPATSQMDLFSQVEPEEEAESSPFFENLRNLEIQSMTPLEALNKLAKWQQEHS